MQYKFVFAFKYKSQSIRLLISQVYTVQNMCMIAFWLIYYFSFCKSLDFEMMFFYYTNTILQVNSKEMTGPISKTEEQYNKDDGHASTVINTWGWTHSLW